MCKPEFRSPTSPIRTERVGHLGKRRIALVGSFSLALMAVSIGTASLPLQATSRYGENAMSFTISSQSFSNGADIDKKFTCAGVDVSPQLSWTEPPAGTKSFALLVDDPDAPAGTWVPATGICWRATPLPMASS